MVPPYSVARGMVRTQMLKRAQAAQMRAQRGERMIGSLLPWRGYSGQTGWDADPYTQIQHLKNWTGVAIDLIAKLCAQLVPNVAWVRQSRTPNTQKWGRHDYSRIKHFQLDGASWLSGTYRRKALGNAVKEHEEVELCPPNHPLCKLIETPNAWDTQFDHDYELIMFQFLCGVAYDWAVPHGWSRESPYGSGPFADYPRELWCIPSHWVWPMTANGEHVSPNHPNADRLIEYYQIWPYGSRGGAGGMKIPPDQIIRYAFKSPVNKVGAYAKTILGRNWIDADDSIAKSQMAQMSNGAFPSFWLELGEGFEDPTDDQIERVEAKFSQRYMGEYAMGRPIIAPPGTVPHPMNFPPIQMAYGEAQDQSRDRILALMGVPKAALGLSEGQTFGSVLATMFGMGAFSLNPLLVANGQTKTKFLAAKFSTPSSPLRIWYDDPAPVDPEQLNRDIETDAKNLAITPNEIRAIRGREPYANGGDDPVGPGPGGMIPIPLQTGEDLSWIAENVPLMGRQENPASEEEEQEAGVGVEKPNGKPNGKPSKRFKSFNEVDHPRADDGKFGPEGGLPTKPEGAPTGAPSQQHASSLAAKAKKLPAAVYQRAANKVKTTYGKLESRYGKKTAIAVMGAGILGLPLPIPGSSILTAAPILVAAELYLKFSGSKEAATLSQDEIEELGKQFIKDLLAGWNVGPRSALPKLSLNGSHK